MKCKMHDVKSSVEKCMLIRFEIVAEINTEHKKEGGNPCFHNICKLYLAA